MADGWRAEFDNPEVKGSIAVCFWRPINMQQPCMHMPLALCDPNTISMDDVVPTALLGFTMSGMPTSQGALKFRAGQQWYYYPNMTNDETICFKQFECMKGVDDQPDAKLKSVYHTAIKDPNTPEGAEPRKSCEFRVQIFFK